MKHVHNFANEPEANDVNLKKHYLSLKSQVPLATVLNQPVSKAYDKLHNIQRNNDQYY